MNTDSIEPSLLNDDHPLPLHPTRHQALTLLQRGMSVSVALLLVTACGGATRTQPTVDADDSSSAAIAVARAYLEALKAGDIEEAGALFAEDSSVFETGGNEGSWSHYADHHLAPELEAIATFTVVPGSPNARNSRDGTMAFVAWPLDYTIALNDGRRIESRGTVSFA